MNSLATGPRSPRRDDWADEIAAFANTNGGVLLCGVTDAGDVQGMSREQMDRLERLISEICSDSISPPVRANIFRRETSEGKPLLMVEVPEGDTLHESSRGSFVRVGSTRRRMTGDERLRLAQRRGQARFLWFDKQTVPGTGFGTLDEALWKPLLSAEGAATPEPALERIALLANDEAGDSALHGNRRVVVHPKPRAMAPQRLHNGDSLPRNGPRFRSD